MRENQSSRIQCFALIGFVFLAILLFYQSIALVQGAWIVADHAEQHFPWANYLAESIKSGFIPFWTQDIHAGYPITAEGQIGTFYLPNLLFYYFLPIEVGYAWNIIFHLLVSGFFMTAYMRTLNLSSRAIFFGVMVYLFGSTLGGAYYNVTSLKVLSWFPLCLMIVDRIIAKSSFQWWKVLFLGFVFSLQLLVGYLQFAAYSILFTGLYMLFRLFDGGAPQWAKAFWGLLGGLVAVAIAAVIAYPQIALTYELAVLSNRANPEEGFAYVGSYPPFAAICLLFPSMEGMFVSKLYLGVIPLFFMIAALYYFKPFPRKSIYWMVAIAFLLALGQFSPLYVGIVKLLKFYSFRTPVKFVFFAGFFLSILCAYGVHQMLLHEDEEKKRKSARTFFVFMGLLIGGSIASYFAFVFLKPQLYNLGEYLVSKFVYGQPGHPFSWEHYEMRLERFIRNTTSVLNPLGPVFLIPVAKVIGAVAIIILFLKKMLKPAVFFLAALGLLVIDLNFTYSDIRGDYQSYERFYQSSQTEEYLAASLKGDSYFVFSHNPSDSPLPAAKNMIRGLKTANGYSPLVTKDYYQFMSALGGVNDSTGYHPINLDYFYTHLYKLRMLGVRVVVSDIQLESPELQLVLEERGWRTYRIRDFESPHRLIEAYEIRESQEAVLSAVDEEGFDFERRLFLEHDPVFAGGSNDQVLQKNVNLIKADHHEVVFNVSAVDQSILRIAQIYYPGWKVEVNGQQASVIRVDGVLSGVALQKGISNVRLYYDPTDGIMSLINK